MEYIVLDLEKATEDQLKAAISCNNNTTKLLKTEVDKLKKVSEAAKKRVTDQNILPQELPKETEDKLNNPKDEDFENEVDYYFSAVRSLPAEKLRQKLDEALPSQQNYQYKRILLRIKAEIMRSIKEIKDLIELENMSLDEISEFKSELLSEYEKLSIINECFNPQKDEKEHNEVSENNLIFVPTPSGNIRIFEELDRIDPDYYERFLVLFQSIKNGTFKNIKRLNGNESTLCEVKETFVRVVFKRLNKDSYAIISAFVKKTASDSIYRNQLTKKSDDFFALEGRLIENLKNEEFMIQNKQYEEELFRKLTPHHRKITPVLIKQEGEVK